MECGERETLGCSRIQGIPRTTPPRLGVGSFHSSQPFRLVAKQHSGGLASCHSVGVPRPLLPPSWGGNSCRGVQPGAVSGHQPTVTLRSVERLGAGLVPVSSWVCVWGFGIEAVNAAATPRSGVPYKGMRAGHSQMEAGSMSA